MWYRADTILLLMWVIFARLFGLLRPEYDMVRYVAIQLHRNVYYYNFLFPSFYHGSYYYCSNKLEY